VGITPVGGRASGATRLIDRRKLALLEAVGRRPDARDPVLLQETAARLVSELFFKPLLAELRGATAGAPFVGGGQAEAVFGSQLDEQLADSAARSGCNGLVEQIVGRLAGAQTRGAAIAGYQEQQAVYA
jgi:Rod binding domain-containing protein